MGVTNGPGVSESGLSTNLGVLSAEVWSKMQPAKKKKNAACNVMIQRKFAERRNGSRAPHFKGWVKEKRPMGGHQDGKIGENGSVHEEREPQ